LYFPNYFSGADQEDCSPDRNLKRAAGNPIITLRENAMKLTITTTVATVMLIAGAAATGKQPSLRISLDAKATDACFNAFAARILPGGIARVRTVISPGGAQVFSAAPGSILADYKVMEVTMTANLARSNDLLAKSVCTVNKAAKVLNLSISLPDPAKLAGLTLKDIKLAVADR
jgi:hypothetical protein